MTRKPKLRGEAALKMLQQLYHRPLSEAAQILGFCLSGMKKHCRRNGVNKWPYRRLQFIERLRQGVLECKGVTGNGSLASHEIVEHIKFLDQQKEELLENPNVDVLRHPQFAVIKRAVKAHKRKSFYREYAAANTLALGLTDLAGAASQQPVGPPPDPSSGQSKYPSQSSSISSSRSPSASTSVSSFRTVSNSASSCPAEMQSTSKDYGRIKVRQAAKSASATQFPTLSNTQPIEPQPLPHQQNQDYRDNEEEDVRIHGVPSSPVRYYASTGRIKSAHFSPPQPLSMYSSPSSPAYSSTSLGGYSSSNSFTSSFSSLASYSAPSSPDYSSGDGASASDSSSSSFNAPMRHPFPLLSFDQSVPNVNSNVCRQSPLSQTEERHHLKSEMEQCSNHGDYTERPVKASIGFLLC